MTDAIDEASALVAWLEGALRTTRLTAEALERAGEVSPWTVAGVPVTSLTPRVLRDAVAADAAILWEHRVLDGRCRVCAATHDDRWQRYRAPCWTLRFLATRYRNVVPGWRSEWSG